MRRINKRGLFLWLGTVLAILGVAGIYGSGLLRTVDAEQLPTKEVDVTLRSQYALLVRLSDQATLLDIKSGEKIYPASMTKIMTVLVVLDEMSDLDTKVLVSNQIISDMLEENASMAGFRGGEHVKAIDLLYGALLPSGGECTAALAEHVGGSAAGFVRLMNEKAQALGMANTHFTNASGLHNIDHYTTCRDMIKLLTAALKNPQFRQLFTTHRYSTDVTDAHDGGITFYSTLFDNLDESTLRGAVILGGKTGYTSPAGLCLASLGEKDGQEYILITAKADSEKGHDLYHIEDAVAVYNAL